MRSVVFDAHAILAYIKAEAGGLLVKSLLADAAAGKVTAGVCALNLGEAYYITARQWGAPAAEILLDQLLHMEWDIVSASNDLTWRAARLKAAHAISYADAFALACAIEREAALVTGDPELHAADHGVELLWDAREDQPSPE